MKSSLLFAGLLGLLFLGAHPLKADDNSGAGDRGKMLSFLSADDKERYLAARKKTMADNPELKAEHENLMKVGKNVMQGDAATPEEKQALFEKFTVYQHKLRQAMLKEDPTLQPIFNQIDQHTSQAWAKKQGTAAATSGSASSTNAAPVAPSAK